MTFPFHRQHDAMDCGPACVQMIASYFGKKVSLDFLRQKCFITKNGVSLKGISHAAEFIGFRTLGVKVPIKKLIDNAPFPCILHWNQNHFVVLLKVKSNKFYIADPAYGIQKIDRIDFEKGWLGPSLEGVTLLIEPTPEFYASELEEERKTKGFSFLLRYIRPFKKNIIQLFVGMLAGSCIALVLPFLMQALVDNGINRQNIDFVQLILLSQLVVFAGSITIDVIRSWILLHMNARINISIISDFLAKLMRLPISFFETRQIGDIKQRIADHSRVQTFLTDAALSMVFSVTNLLVFATVMAIYSFKILFIFLFFSLIGTLWIVFFLKRRKQLDYIRFQRASANENVMYELITGMQEIKLNNCETTKRWGWERVQAKLFSLSVRTLSLSQTQSIGSSFFNQLKNILISYISAREVINGNMTLGMMMSISYIVGQLNSPFSQLLGFIQSAQDAKVSLDRISEIHGIENEDVPGLLQGINLLKVDDDNDNGLDINGPMSMHAQLRFSNVSFQYQGIESPLVLNDLNLEIPAGKITAVVGMSGSGKTTMLKLLLQYYYPTKGSIHLDKIDLKEISPSWWRRQCGTVLQDGYIFNDTIIGNIALEDENVDHLKLKKAIETANLQDFIRDLPLGYNTQLGLNGVGISSGQKQRILIARAVYKNPSFLLFDEATSTLDANNEKVIMNNLNSFFKGKTVVVIAHRLSTVKNADQIIVLDKGLIAEKGTHQSLLESKGAYYELVKNQLELDTSYE